MKGHAFRMVFVATVLSGTFVLSGCGKGGDGLKIVKDVKLKTFEMDGDAWAEMKATLDIGNISLPSVDIPIQDPSNPLVEIGHLRILNIPSGGSELAFAVNISQTSGKVGLDGTLPNGLPIPVGGLDGVGVIGIPISSSGSKAYVALGPGTAVLGVAVVIKELDKIKIPIPINFFPAFDVGNNVKGVAGLFTGSGARQSGLALFVDASSLLDDLDSMMMQSRGTIRLATARSIRTYMPSAGFRTAKAVNRKAKKRQKVFFIAQEPRRKYKRKLQYQMYKLHKKRAKLRMH